MAARRNRGRRTALTLLLLFAAFTPSAVLAEALTPQNLPRDAQQTPKELAGSGLRENLGGRLPLELPFTDQTGKSVRFGDYFKSGRPVLLNLAYYECPMLCTLVLNGVADAVAKLAWQPGKDFQMLTVSIDPRETAELAARKQQVYLDYLGRNKQVPADGWAFLVGKEAVIKTLAESLGFDFAYDTRTQQFAHPAATFLVTADGKISRYLYGVTYTAKDMKLALVEAGQGKVGSTLDRLILSCYAYDPDARGYVLAAMQTMRLAGGVAVLLVSGMLGLFWYRERHKSRISHG